MDYFNNCLDYIHDLAQNCQEMLDCVKKDILIDKIQRMAEDILDQEHTTLDNKNLKQN